MSNSPDASDRFSKQTVETLAKRAGNTCSNPDCKAPTSGPSDEPSRAVNVGEAAHIYGARPGSARFRAEMTSAERSEITNGVWLCRNCHRQVDENHSAFSADMLFVWRQTHEAVTAAALGKANVEVRRKALSRIPGFEQISYLAQQILIDKPDLWEFKLSVELLRAGLEPLLWRWRSLQQNLYHRPGQRIEREQLLHWYQDQIKSLPRQIEALDGLLNRELQAAWGPPGTAGSELAIVRTTGLLVEACAAILQWEEQVRFANLPSDFDECRALLCGIGGRMLEATFSVPEKMGSLLADDTARGTHVIDVVFDLPPRWSENISRSFERAMHQVYGAIG